MKKINSNTLTGFFRFNAPGFLFLSLFTLLPLLLQGTAISVSGDYPTIQAAINAAMDGDEIIVPPGTYRENINFGGKNIILRSTDPASTTVVASTIIDGNNAGSVVTFSGTEEASCVLSGFTITNGYALMGAGIFGNGTLATIQYNVIKDNFAYPEDPDQISQPDGCGAGLHGCDGLIQYNTIWYNRATNRGGGFYNCNGTIQNNLIYRNYAQQFLVAFGGGFSNCNATIQNNIIWYNIASSTLSSYGGGLYECNGTILNNTMYENGAGMDGGGLTQCQGTIRNCILWRSSLLDCSTPSYCCIKDWTGGGTGNISDDPQFVYLPNQYVDPTIWDLHLQPTSPCIDAGGTVTLAQDFEGDPRPLDGTSEPRGDGSDFDIGADEFLGAYVPTPTPTPTPTATPTPTPSPIPCSIYVPQDYPTIQGAIDAAEQVCEIVVSPGTYVENINFGGRNVILRSTDPTDLDIVASTIIDGNQASSAVTFSGTESDTCVLSGFTVTNGKSTNGGGISGNGTLAAIHNNVIAANVNAQYGAGIYDCDGVIQNNVIVANSANFGGGAALCDGAFQNNTVFGNQAQYGGGLYRCNGTVTNCIIWQNSATEDGAQLYLGTTPAYSCIQDWSADGSGNITSDPLLVDPDNMDFHLTSASLCIDAGGTVSGLTQDFEGDVRPYDAVAWETRGDGSDFDIGADEFFGTVQPNPPEKPTNLSPPNGASRISLTPTLTSSAFSDPDPGDRHLASQWQLDDNSDFSSPEIDSGITSLNKTTMNVPSGKLTYSTTYYWRVRYEDSDSFWSEWSDATSFTTRSYGVIFVPDDYSTIQGAINSASNGEQIIVSPGTYRERINFRGKDIVLSSSDPTSTTVVARTIIDGQAAGSVVTFSGSEPPSCVLSGFTIGNGRSTVGAGIRGNGTHATIQNNNITSNSGPSGNPSNNWGAGLHNCDGLIQFNHIRNNICYGGYSVVGYGKNQGGGLYGCDGVIQYNTISNNRADACYYLLGIYWVPFFIGDGGGLYGCNGTIQSNIISNNEGGYGGGLCACNGTIRNNAVLSNAGDIGGGLYGCVGTIENNTISGNRASGYNSYGAGLAYCIGGLIQNNIITGNWAGNSSGGLSSCGPTIRNNTIYGNSADEFGGGLVYCTGINNCIIWQNTAPRNVQMYGCETPAHCCIQDWTGEGVGNISSDPQLVDPENDDFHLKSTSPCIDAGGDVPGLTQDFEGDPRPFDGTSEPRGDGTDYDIGADEFIGTITYDFTDSEEAWTPVSVGALSSPDLLWETGRLIMVSHTNTNTFGFWQSPQNAVPVAQGYLYRARFRVSSDMTDQSRVPQIRFRANSLNLQQYDMVSIESAGDGGASPATAGTDYDLYFVPAANDSTVLLAFDLLNSNPDDEAVAEVALDRVTIDRFALDSLPAATAIKDYTFDVGTEGWTTGGAPLFYKPPQYIHAGGTLELHATTSTNTFGFWGNDPQDITIEADRLYRGRFEVRTDVADRARVPEMRLRFNTGNLQASHTLGILSAGDGANSPGTTNRTYGQLYFLPPANCVGEGLLVSFDIRNLSPDDEPNASLMLDRATIETLSPPLSP
jgi:hypothetical protein